MYDYTITFLNGALIIGKGKKGNKDSVATHFSNPNMVSEDGRQLSTDRNAPQEGEPTEEQYNNMAIGSWYYYSVTNEQGQVTAVYRVGRMQVQINDNNELTELDQNIYS